MNRAAYALALWCGLPAFGADFEKEVAPILAARCLECHNATEAAGGLRLVSEAGLRKGGDEGAVLDPAAAHGGRLLERIKAGEMPPESKGKSQKLPAAEIATLEAWIKSGAPWPKGRIIDPFERTSPARGGRDWWSLQPVKRSEPPLPKSGAKKFNPIDAFLETEREKAGLVAAPAADRRTLLRRVYYTLHGLPPTAAELDAFAADDRPDAYERAVDKLLASPRYGERWGRHWLDVARYAETSGYERDQEKPGAWKYRDWVIAAFNSDMPFDRFVHEQLAGDEIPGRTEASTIATGFLRLGTWNDEPNDPGEYVYERLDDLVHATSAAFLGLTVRCARCHDHKFDPIPQTDYYRLATAFWAGPMTERKREWVGGPSKEELGFDVLGWTDVRMPPPPLHLLKKGDARHPAEPIAPATLSILPKLEKPMAPPAAGAKTAGRRRQLADWLCDPANPLPARVYVNRLWIHHFGKGLVRSPNNFGFKGDLPTNPALLDWMASELRRNGGKTKPLQRLIVLSEAYRLASIHPRQAEFANKDPENKLWWRAERRRVDAESLRDAALVVTGELDRKLGGPSFKGDVDPDALEGLSTKTAAWKASPPAAQLRRSVYSYVQRSLAPPLLATFDLCDSSEPCGQRETTMVAPQALALLNNRFFHERSEKLAAKIASQGSAREEQIRQAWRAVLGRPPSATETRLALEHLDAQAARFAERSAPAGKNAAGMALASLCHSLINANEFLYID